MMARSWGVSFNKMLKMTPGELHQVDPKHFQYIRAKDVAEFPDELLFALHPEQVKMLKPISFSEVEPKKLHHLLTKLTELVPDEEDEVIVTDEEGKEKKQFGAKETIRRAIKKAEEVQAKKRELEELRSLRDEDALIGETNFMNAHYVAAKLDITLRFMYNLADAGEFEMLNMYNKLVVEKHSFLDYLNRSRVAGSKLDEKGKPLYKTITDPDTKEVAVMEAPDERGVMKPVYEAVELEPITEIPTLYAAEVFAKEIGVDHRTFIRNCNAGFYDYYKLGATYKMSKEDFHACIQRNYEAQTKASTGRKPQRLKYQG
ncbi:hypothetical protein ACFYKX_10135 [Cytobacillus sp. FJAT-54145]|uniref:Uncharacterized protein n=1 Tax=Cytobacillus spartinae TaxID=3299023 RepID=A0ABW6K9V1_9BACI